MSTDSTWSTWKSFNSKNLHAIKEMSVPFKRVFIEESIYHFFVCSEDYLINNCPVSVVRLFWHFLWQKMCWNQFYRKISFHLINVFLECIWIKLKTDVKTNNLYVRNSSGETKLSIELKRLIITNKFI